MNTISVEFKTFSSEKKRRVDEHQQDRIRHELAANLVALQRTKGFGKHWLSGWTKIPIETITELELGRKTERCVTVETLNRIARIFFCDPVFRIDENEISCGGAAMILEDFIRVGIWITLEE